MLSRRQTLASLFAASATPALAQPRTGWAKVETLGEKLVAEKAVPGLQLTVRKRGRNEFSRGFGYADLEDGARMTPQTVCKIGSVTKQFTASTLLLLVQDGKLSLDDRLAKFLPGFPRGQDITLRRMLSHTSGLGNYTNMENRRAFLQASRLQYDTDELIALMRRGDRVQVFEPGTAWAYSNTAYVLLGVVIGMVAGKPYGEVMRDRLFQPLNLSHTAVDDAAEVLPGRAQGYSNDPRSPSGFRNTSFIDMTVPGGAGNLRSTTEDLCAWHEALLGGRVLRPEMLKEMLTPALTNDGQLPKDPSGREVRYGFGQQLGDVDGRHSVVHGGGIQGFSSNLQTFPDQAVTIARIFNTDGPMPPQVVATGAAFQAAVVAAALA